MGKTVRLKASMKVEAGSGPKRTKTADEFEEFARDFIEKLGRAGLKRTCGRCAHLRDGDEAEGGFPISCEKQVFRTRVKKGTHYIDIPELMADRSDCEFFEPNRYVFR